jgi:membrane associated rhomboid family serine protease
VFVRVDEHPKIRLRWATAILLALMVGIAVWESLLNSTERDAFFRAYGTVPTDLLFNLAHLRLSALKLFSALFVHVDTAHLLGNVLFLTLFGFAVERVFRSRLVFVLFLLSGGIANIAAALLIKGQVPIVGASGAVSGLIGAYLYLFPRASLGVVLPLGLYFHFVRVPAPVLIGLWFLLQVLYTITSPTISTVAWLAHIIGFVTGFILAAVLRPLLYSNARVRTLN